MYLPCMRIKDVHRTHLAGKSADQLLRNCCERPRANIRNPCCCKDCFNDVGHTAECNAKWRTEFVEGEKEEVALWMLDHIARTRILQISSNIAEKWISRNWNGPMKHIYPELCDENQLPPIPENDGDEDSSSRHVPAPRAQGPRWSLEDGS